MWPFNVRLQFKPFKKIKTVNHCFSTIFLYFLYLCAFHSNDNKFSKCKGPLRFKNKKINKVDPKI